MDELLLSKVRLAVVAELVTAEWVAFSDLRSATGATNGNLGTHLGKLLAADYVEEQKRFVRRRPQTRYRLTATGRSALLQHVRALQALAEEAGERPAPAPEA